MKKSEVMPLIVAGEYSVVQTTISNKFLFFLGSGNLVSNV